MRKKKKGQSILEYVIVLLAIIAAIAAAARGVLSTGIANSYNEVGRSMEDSATALP